MLLAQISQHFPITNFIIFSCRPCVCYRFHLSYLTRFDSLIINEDENYKFQLVQFSTAAVYSFLFCPYILIILFPDTLNLCFSTRARRVPYTEQQQLFMYFDPGLLRWQVRRQHILKTTARIFLIIFRYFDFIDVMNKAMNTHMTKFKVSLKYRISRES